MATNILSLPLVSCTVETGTNEDWRDSFAFQVAGAAVGYPASTNIGNGTLGAITVGSGTPIGDSVVRILSVSDPTTAFEVADLDGNVIGIGVVGAAFSAAGFGFTLSQGGTAFSVGDAFTISVKGAPIDLTGIFLSLAVREAADATDVLLSGSTGDGSLSNSGTTGIMSTAFAQARIAQHMDGGKSYGFDVIAVADGIKRRVISGTLNIVDGYSFTFA